MAEAAAHRQATRLVLLSLAGVGMLLTVFSMAFHPRPLLVWNASASAPVGLYRVLRRSRFVPGDTVVAKLSPQVAALASERAYLPTGIPLVKRVAAVEGSHVCALGQWLQVNGRPAALLKEVDRLGRPLPRLKGCRTLNKSEVLLLSGDPWSFDSRYFGPLSRSQILGKARLIWPG